MVVRREDNGPGVTARGRTRNLLIHQMYFVEISRDSTSCDFIWTVVLVFLTAMFVCAAGVAGGVATGAILWYESSKPLGVTAVVIPGCTPFIVVVYTVIGFRGRLAQAPTV
ncbi:uncharacterized protein EDB91DRAFT_576820 [Suillus paluster]|uniref:uncharacterized protein n=1 Tax=Suillus paluster TaxID=48578 RepID=UPI001B86D1B1|nr:uncharacterized protein EDB91DRAFT_576820 [Suillus paluster]KAG1734928.1 hypothetical protein EDB91DRAFT_576820 [Suillus paluster]